ncbi:MAG: hypothetical protein M3R57_05615, partial [Chloroflexota bacterium]|nr:hypothetical protein [Chloroflexota bacterium]
MSAHRHGAGLTLALAAIVAVLAGCGVGAPVNQPATFPPTTFGPGEATGAEVAATRQELARALGAVGLELADP